MTALLSYALVDTSAAKSFLGFTGSDDDMNFYINAVTEYIEKKCNRRFSDATYTEKFDGKGSDEMAVLNPPINSITSLSRRTSADNTDSWETINASDYWYDADEGLVKKTTIFEHGKQNYKIVYNGGWTTIPFDIQYLAMALIQEYITAKKGAGIKRESLGDHSIEFNFESTLRDDSGLMDIINNYRLIPI